MEGSGLGKLVGSSPGGQLEGHTAKPCMNTQASCPMLLLTTARAAAREQSGPLTAITTSYLRPLIRSNPRELSGLVHRGSRRCRESNIFLFIPPRGKREWTMLVHECVDMHFTNQTGARLCKMSLSQRPFPFPPRD